MPKEANAGTGVPPVIEPRQVLHVSMVIINSRLPIC